MYILVDLNYNIHNYWGRYAYFDSSKYTKIDLHF